MLSGNATERGSSPTLTSRTLVSRPPASTAKNETLSVSVFTATSVDPLRLSAIGADFSFSPDGGSGVAVAVGSGVSVLVGGGVAVLTTTPNWRAQISPPGKRRLLNGHCASGHAARRQRGDAGERAAAETLQRGVALARLGRHRNADACYRDGWDNSPRPPW